MKYMIMMFGDQSGMADKSPEWIEKMLDFMHQIDTDLRDSGELVFEAGLADAPQAKTVGIQNGIPVATDGPFAESRESLAGFWVVDVESEGRAIEIASQVVEVIDARVEVRQVMDAPPDDVLQQAGL